MKISRLWVSLIMCGVVCTLSACASGSSFVRPGYDFHSVGKTAVLLTSSNIGDPAVQAEVADLFAMHLLSKGYDVIDRANIADLMKEAEFQNASGITSPEGRAKLAIHNVSAVVVTNVSQLGDEISMTAKMVDVESGSLLWAGEGTGSMRRWLAPVGGGLLGAGAGAVTGAVIGGTRGAIIGGVAGGAGGATAGAALQPAEAKLLRRVIAKTCRALPSVAPE